MKTRLYFALCCVLIWCGVALSEGDNDVKRGLFPFMGFLYYPDETVVDGMGSRFLRSAVLIRPDWLLSAAIDHLSVDNVPLGFPRKTLLARMGAIAIDFNFTLNEDEDEQEREVIQIVRPNLHNQESWWFTDISLLKTLLPFKSTFAVGPTAIAAKRDYIDKNCIILVYAKRYGNATEDRNLMQLTVELLPPTIENCGNQFSETTMTCASDSDETKNAVYDPEFCQGSSGGPLMCEGEVMGLQTYIDGNCKQPHLYQLLHSWDSFISCGTAEKCNQDYICNICTVTNKDNTQIREKATVIAVDLPTATTTLNTSETNVTTTSPTMNITNKTTETTLLNVELREDEEIDKADQSTKESTLETTKSTSTTETTSTSELPPPNTSPTAENTTVDISTQTTNSTEKPQTKFGEHAPWTASNNNDTDSDSDSEDERIAKLEARRVVERHALRERELSSSSTFKNNGYLLMTLIPAVFTSLLVM